jgi:AraC family transcriptional regulator, L-rhamnose operon regulatory protein RhaS
VGIQRSIGGARTIDWFPDLRCRRIGIDYIARSISRSTVGDEAWAGLGRHQHDAWEITWLRSGSLAWWAQRSTHDLGPGWCHITAPGTPHGSCSGLLEPCEMWWAQIDLRRLDGVAPGTAVTIERNLRRLPTAFRIGNILEPWQALLAAIGVMPADSVDALADLDARACLHRLLVRVLAGPACPDPSPRLMRAQRRADEGPASVAALARAAGCSVATLHRLFRDEIGDTPAAWLQQRRLQVARRLLRTTSASVTSIAIDLGFRTGQHFATSFRKLTGLTPSRYRELAGRAAVSS